MQKTKKTKEMFYRGIGMGAGGIAILSGIATENPLAIGTGLSIEAMSLMNYKKRKRR